MWRALPEPEFNIIIPSNIFYENYYETITLKINNNSNNRIFDGFWQLGKFYINKRNRRAKTPKKTDYTGQIFNLIDNANWFNYANY